MRLAPFALALLLAAAPAQAQSTATYSLSFESSWSAATHPDGFPPSPHYSGLVGATHAASTVLWEPGGLASRGIEVMAESGSKSVLLDEVAALIASGAAERSLSGSGIGLSPGAASLSFDVTEAHPAVTVVSMLAPSPDWFVGTHGLVLREADAWRESVEVELFVYDAGTDSGPDYTSPNQNTEPQEPIARIDASPFRVGGELVPVGTYTFTLLAVVAEEDAPEALGLSLSAPRPNPAASGAEVLLTLGSPSVATVEVYDLLGRRVQTVATEAMPAGTHPLSIDTKALAPGLYTLRADVGGTVLSTRLTVL